MSAILIEHRAVDALASTPAQVVAKLIIQIVTIDGAIPLRKLVKATHAAGVPEQLLWAALTDLLRQRRLMMTPEVDAAEDGAITADVSVSFWRQPARER